MHKYMFKQTTKNTLTCWLIKYDVTNVYDKHIYIDSNCIIKIYLQWYFKVFRVKIKNFIATSTETTYFEPIKFHGGREPLNATICSSIRAIAGRQPALLALGMPCHSEFREICPLMQIVCYDHTSYFDIFCGCTSRFLVAV